MYTFACKGIGKKTIAVCIHVGCGRNLDSELELCTSGPMYPSMGRILPKNILRDGAFETALG